MGGVTTALEDAFRRDWPQILGAVVRYTGDLDVAEDAVQEAFTRAVEAEADSAAIRNPSAWITTVARRIAIDTLRRGQTLGRVLPSLAHEEERERDVDMPDDLLGFSGDERLLLIFMVCHPDLSEESRVALALRFVCGVPTAEIADVFLVSESTMAARLTRAKKRLQTPGFRLGLDQPGEAEPRVDDVLTTLYLLYTLGHTAPAGSEVGSAATRETAIQLARDVVRLLPAHREASGLLALLLLTEARQAGRVDASGELFTLEEADRSQWNDLMIEEGLRHATLALGGGGRFALQGGIAGVHAQARSWSATDWTAIARLYDRLIIIWPAPSAELSRIVARSYAPEIGPARALAELDGLAPRLGAVLEAQGWAARGDMLRRLGRNHDAAVEYARARDVERNAKVRDFLSRRVDELSAADSGWSG
jgi:RNA polymerase sigma-70 factor, ECF subfamily